MRGSILALYQCPDLTETQPDAHKYVPLFLPLCAFQLGGFVLGVLSIFQPQPHVARKRELNRPPENAELFPLRVFCHGGDLPKAAQLESSVRTMETCLS